MLVVSHLDILGGAVLIDAFRVIVLDADRLVVRGVHGLVFGLLEVLISFVGLDLDVQGRVDKVALRQINFRDT
jgi:hypothetical protein